MSRRSSHEHVVDINGRKLALTLAVGVLLLAGAVTLIGQVGDLGEMLEALRRADKRWFALAVAGQLLAYAGYVVAFQSVARVEGGPLLSYWTTTRLVFVSFGAYIAGSSAGGLAVNFWALHRATDNVHEAARRVLAFGALQWAVLGGTAVVASATALARDSRIPLAMTISWLVVVPALVGAAAWTTAAKRVERLAALRCDVPEERGTSVRKWMEWVVAMARNAIADAVGGVLFARRVVVKPLPCSAALLGLFVYWAGPLLVIYGLLLAFGAGPIGVPALILAFATGYVVTGLPLPAGGAGSVEATLAVTFHLVGVPLSIALLTALTYRFVTFWLPIPLALAFLPSVRTLADELPETKRGR